MRKHRTRTFLTLALATLASAGLVARADSGSGKDKNEDRPPKILEWQTMVGVPRPYTGATNAIRGVAGGGLPWIAGPSKGELSADGKLEIEVTGLVFDPSDQAVMDRGLGNQNTVAAFRAIVSCLSKDALGNATTVNILTEQFPATTGLALNGGGNAKIETRVVLPSPCIAPIVFVTNPGGAWFASTGR